MIRIPKHKPPSRIRYEKSHPTIGFRLDRELKKRLEKVLEGKSFADFVKEGLGVREREKVSLESEYKKGYDEAKRIYGVHTHCSICGGKLMIDKEEEKKDIERFLENKYYHVACKEEQKRKREKIASLFKNED